jgi:hypothetical protein
MANAGHAPAPPGSRVAVYGATGHTGRFVVAELAARVHAGVRGARPGEARGLGLSRARRRGRGGLDRRAAELDSASPGLRDNQAGAAARTASASSRTAARIAGRGSWP